jgi:uncharacterized membrane protein YgcG
LHVIGILQGHFEELDGPDENTLYLTRREKHKFTDDVGSGKYGSVFVVVDHADGEKTMLEAEKAAASGNENLGLFVAPPEKQIGLLHETMVDPAGNLHGSIELFHHRPETKQIMDDINKGIPWGLSVCTDYEKLPGRTLKKRISHIGITKNPEFGPDSRTWLFHATTSASTLNDIMRNHYLNFPGMYVAKETRKRYGLPESSSGSPSGSPAGSGNSVQGLPSPHVTFMSAGATRPTTSKLEEYTNAETSQPPSFPVPVAVPSSPPSSTTMSHLIPQGVPVSDVQPTPAGIMQSVNAPQLVQGSVNYGAKINEAIAAQIASGMNPVTSHGQSGNSNNVPQQPLITPVNDMNLSPNAFVMQKQREQQQFREDAQRRDAQVVICQRLNSEFDKVYSGLNEADDSTYMDEERLTHLLKLKAAYDEAIEHAGWQRPGQYPAGVMGRLGKLDQYVEKSMLLLEDGIKNTSKTDEDRIAMLEFAKDPLKYRPIVGQVMANVNTLRSARAAEEAHKKEVSELADLRKYKEENEKMKAAAAAIAENEKRDNDAKRKRDEEEREVQIKRSRFENPSFNNNNNNNPQSPAPAPVQFSSGATSWSGQSSNYNQPSTSSYNNGGGMSNASSAPGSVNGGGSNGGGGGGGNNFFGRYDPRNASEVSFGIDAYWGNMTLDSNAAKHNGFWGASERANNTVIQAGNLLDRVKKVFKKDFPVDGYLSYSADQ